MLTIRTDSEIDEMIAFLRIHKVKFTHRIKEAMRMELINICSDFKMKEKRIKDAPDWLYENM